MRALRREAPVAWSEAYGGFWVVSRYADVARVASDWRGFSSRNDSLDPSSPFRGNNVPPSPVRATPIEVDPPEFHFYRELLRPWFTRSKARSWEGFIERITDSCVRPHLEHGRIDFVAHLANPAPAMIVLALLGLPVDDWERWAAPAHGIAAFPLGTPEHEEAVAGIHRNEQELRRLAEARRDDPRDDLLSDLATAKRDGGPIPLERVVEAGMLLIVAAVDSVTAVLAHTLLWLAANPDQRRRLVEEPALIPTACEEFLRYFTPVQALARTSTGDVRLDGASLQRHDRVVISWASANRDESAFDRADEVVLDRRPNRHLAFGLGIHRCVGRQLARSEFRVILRRVLHRIPEYEVEEEGVRGYRSVGLINGLDTLPAVFPVAR
jgi:cytochrome P450